MTVSCDLEHDDVSSLLSGKNTQSNFEFYFQPTLTMSLIDDGACETTLALRARADSMAETQESNKQTSMEEKTRERPGKRPKRLNLIVVKMI